MQLPRAIIGPFSAALWSVLAACAVAVPGRVLLREDGFEIRLDTTRVERETDGSYRLHFETRHARPRMVGDRPFDRGRLELLVRCAPLGFKTVGQVLSLGDGPAVFRQESPLAALADSAWKPAPAGSIDGRFLAAACAALGTPATRRAPPD